MSGREIPEEIVPLIEGSVASWLATCDGALVPEATRVRGVRVDPARFTLTVFVPTEQAGVTFENLRHNRRIALYFCRIADYRAVQLKGEVLSVRASNDDDRALQARFMSAFGEAVTTVGARRETVARFVYWPSHAVEIRVDEVFMQTPGLGSGRRWP
jgi:Pyridoxamine 5'-phosphate oxidase